MELPPSFVPFINCSTCEVDVPMHMLASHVCQRPHISEPIVEDTTNPGPYFASVLHQPMVEEPEAFDTMSSLSPLAQPSSGLLASRPGKPSLPRIDSAAAARSMTINGELTPGSSGPGSAISPISPGSGRSSPYLHPPRKASASAARRPPSSEMRLPLDCAFPPFPTGKPKKKDTQARIKPRSRTQTPDPGTARAMEQDKLRSASLGGPSLHADGSHSPLSPSPRQDSFSSGPDSRQGSVDVPRSPAPVPDFPFTATTEPQPQGLYESPAVSPTMTTVSPVRSETLPPPEPPTVPQKHEPIAGLSLFPPRNASLVPDIVTSTPDSQDPSPTEPLYRSKRPPPMENMPSSLLQQTHTHQLSQDQSNQPNNPIVSVGRTLSNLFGRKRGMSTTSRKSGKGPATDGPRFIALSPDPDPQDILFRDQSAHGSVSTDMVASPPLHGGIQEVPRASMDVQTTQSEHQIPEPSQAQMAHSDDDDDSVYDSELEENDDNKLDSRDIHAMHTGQQDRQMDGEVDSSSPHAPQRDTLQMEEDLEKRLAAMGAPRLSVVQEDQEVADIKHASINSASSYGSVGFSHASMSSRSIFDGHSQGSSISTRRTTSTFDETIIAHMPKLKDLDTMPESPVDPFLLNGHFASPTSTSSLQDDRENRLETYHPRNNVLTPVPEVLSPDAEKEEPFAHVMVPVPPTPASETESFDFSTAQQRQRRPSTPGGFKGFCRGCSKRILSGQKSVSSKDGRLTGRYHKECFVCMTCKEPFATADFYVHDDHPYCSHHYHERNGTLCESCGQGIEGQYMETSGVSGAGTKKFHPDCLKCNVCSQQLSEDYFELGGKVYCEKDAFRMAGNNTAARSPYDTAPSRPSPLNREYVASVNPAQGLSTGRFPERRLTRLMNA